METSVKAAEVLVPPQPDEASSTTRAEETAPPASIDSSDPFDPMVEMSRRLEDIISTYGSANQDAQSLVEKEPRKEAARDDVTMETEVSAVIQSLDKFSSPEDKLGALVRKYSELAALRRLDEKKLSVLQAESRSSIAARGKLEALCRELQRHYNTLRDEAIQSCREDEQKRSEMANHFQTKLTEIQDQIEQHNARNDKLCSENLNLTDKLESLMNQCELREESLDKINKHRDLQHKLTEAKLQQANALLAEAEEKHKREKEYLLREAIDKTKKCFAMKEQELTMKKKLALYAQKFDEFQETLAKSNQIYAHFKKEMEKMSDKMKKLEIESDLWKTRFENCNKALTDMIEERTEKSKEYEVFVLKIQKLEKLCRALQEERVVLYDKIKEVRQASGPSKELSPPGPEDVDQSALLSPSEIQEIQDEDPVLTKDMTRLKEEQAKLQEFAASLWDSPVEEEEEVHAREEPKEDVVVSAFAQFRTRGPQQAADPEPQDPEPQDPEPGAAKVQTQVEDKEEPAAQQSPAEPAPAEPEEAQTSPEDLKVQAEAEKTESAPPTAPESAPPTAPESAPPTATESAPPTATESAPPTAPESAPPTAPELAPPTAPESAPPIVPVSAPPTAPESAPPTVPVSAPPTAPVSAPPTVPVSAPPSATESAPPTAPPTAPPATASSSDSSKKQTPKKKKRRNHKS
ncbi:uncharacterized protein V6R79_020927 [Siganus canaliculatus]